MVAHVSAHLPVPGYEGLVSTLAYLRSHRRRSERGPAYRSTSNHVVVPDDPLRDVPDPGLVVPRGGSLRRGRASGHLRPLQLDSAPRTPGRSCSRSTSMFSERRALPACLGEPILASGELVARIYGRFRPLEVNVVLCLQRASDQGLHSEAGRAVRIREMAIATEGSSTCRCSASPWKKHAENPELTPQP